jgi:hypothetical protein
MKMVVAITVAAVALAGCAASPQQSVNQLDVRGEKYDTAECRASRQVAMSYDDNVGSRAGVGLALGLFLGPFGLPIAFAMDMNQKEKRDAVISELKRHCEGPLPVSYKAPAKTDLQLKMEILDDLKTKGLITESDYASRKVKLTE